MKLKLSVIIVTYNSTNLIERCLDTLFAFNDLGNDLEVIIVDNNSSDVEKLVSILDSKYASVKLVKNELNGGYGQGNNIGIDKASGDIILIMNPDVFLFKNILNRGVGYFQEFKDLGILGMQQYESENVRSQSFLLLRRSVLGLFIHKVYSKLNLFNKNFFCFSGACFFIRKEAFIDAGKFDERIFLYGEERDLHYRIVKRTKFSRIIYLKNLGYIHPTHARDFSLKPMKISLDSFIHFCQKNNLNVVKRLKEERNLYVLKYWQFSFMRKNRNLRDYYKEVIQMYNVAINEYD